jgi:hypothetical protein
MRTLYKLCVLAFAAAVCGGMPTGRAADLELDLYPQPLRRLPQPQTPAHSVPRAAAPAASAPAQGLKPKTERPLAEQGQQHANRDAVTPAPAASIAQERIPPHDTWVFPLFLLTLALVLGVLGVILIPTFAQAIDSLFEPAESSAPLDLAPEGMPQPSTDDHQHDIAVMRAMIDHLQAQAADARAAIEDALLHARTQHKDDAA